MFCTSSLFSSYSVHSFGTTSWDATHGRLKNVVLLVIHGDQQKHDDELEFVAALMRIEQDETLLLSFLASAHRLLGLYVEGVGILYEIALGECSTARYYQITWISKSDTCQKEKNAPSVSYEMIETHTPTKNEKQRTIGAPKT